MYFLLIQINGFWGGLSDISAETATVLQISCGHHTFTYDQVFGGGGKPPEQLFGECILPLCNAVFNGYNATVFAYGQTGSGKTFTMGSQYTPGQPPAGVIPQVMHNIFERIASATGATSAVLVGTCLYIGQVTRKTVHRCCDQEECSLLL